MLSTKNSKGITSPVTMNKSSTVCKNSVFIPRVFPNISKSRIIALFEGLDIAVVDHIDFHPKQNSKGEKYNSVYVHFKYWLPTDASRIWENNLRTNKEVKLVYDDPWYWTVLENISTKNDNNNIKELAAIDLPLQKGVKQSTLRISAKAWEPKTKKEEPEPLQKKEEPKKEEPEPLQKIFIADVEQQKPPVSSVSAALKKKLYKKKTTKRVVMEEGECEESEDQQKQKELNLQAANDFIANL